MPCGTRTIAKPLPLIVNQIEKPLKRNKLRQIFGKEYFVLKRKFNWLFDNKHYSKTRIQENFTNLVFEHQSLILRPLLGVDMKLQRNKKKNLEIAVKNINKIEIQPNETLSLWKLIGRPTKQKGYLEGLVLKNGKIDSGIGGGLCQLGNLMFWIFAHSPLTITERYRHGYDVFPGVNRKVPFGAGATLAYNYIDLQITNKTENSFNIELFVNQTHLVGKLYSKNKIETEYKIEERNHKILRQIWGGYSRHNQIFKISKDSNSKKEELIVENHAIMMYEPILEEKN